jgi:acyl-CoA reductase-like NAD-dependent aldehyde dehydrogenase
VGETDLGRTVSSLAGKHLKKSSIFLEGNNPLLILKDANLELATSEIVKGICINSGQNFNSPKRIIVDTNVYNEFKIKLI